MKRILFLAVLMAVATFAMAEQVVVSTKGMSLVLNVEKGRQPQYVYFGRHLSSSELQQLQSPVGGRMDAYPAYGMNAPAEAALAMRHADGNLSTELVATGVERLKNDGNQITIIHMKDPVYPVTVDLKYKEYKDVDMMEVWTEITNNEKGTVTLTQFYSGCLPIRRGDVWLSHLHGSWGNEGRVVEEPLAPGVKLLKNKDGVRNSHTDHGEVMFSLDGKGRENAGDVIGAAICYSGNYQLKIDTDDTEYHYFFAGINPDNSEYHLKRGETFKTPALALTFSQEGLSGASRNFHKWGRKYMLMHGNQERKILLNSWEGVYFDINQKGMDQMMGDIAQMGGELFVMDDGWFGVKYPRKTDNSSLGDWEVDRQKLPEGIEGLLRDAKKHGIKFGIWIEPEMVNTKSELFERHPEWALQTKGRDLKLGRGGTQLVLDMTNPKVQDFVFKIVDDLLTQNPEIAYIKWDANASIQNYGSLYLPKNRQQNLYIDYHLGLLKTLQRIRAKYPDIVIQDCASGGGRANYGLLPYFDEFWTSDNTDALQRVFIQWGTSLFFPANAMACHINHCPYWNTGGRVIPIKFRCDVAMSGRLGIELQPKDMTDEERKQTSTCIADYKQLREVVQTGNLYRLISPYDKKGVSSLMYTDDTRRKAVLFVYKIANYYDQSIPRVRLAGLNPDATYTLTEKNVRVGQKPCALSGKRFTGRFLMEVGLEMPLREEYASRVFYIED